MKETTIPQGYIADSPDERDHVFGAEQPVILPSGNWREVPILAEQNGLKKKRVAWNKGLKGFRSGEKRGPYVFKAQHICEECKVKFVGPSTKKWCDLHAKKICVCRVCKDIFFVKASEWKEGRGKYCSILCAKETYITSERIAKEKHPRWKGGINNVIARRARLRGAIGTHLSEEWNLLKAMHAYLCACCGNIEPNIKLEEDHVVPLSKGGSNSISNIQPLCRSCNASKHDKTISYVGA